MSLIDINYEHVIKEAGRIEALSEELRSIAGGGITDALSPVGTAWTGTGAQEYLKRGEMLRDRLMGQANHLRSIASALRAAAVFYRDLEQTALR